MKKLIAILMVLVSIAFAGGWSNLFNGMYLTTSTIDDYIRIPCWDETNGNRVELEMDVLENHLYLKAISDRTFSVDTNTVVADVSAATLSISGNAGELIRILGVYPGGTWDDSDFIEFNNADSNATTLDTMNLGIANAWKTEGAFDFYCTQDTVIYINLGDTVTVSSSVSAKVKYEKR